MKNLGSAMPLRSTVLICQPFASHCVASLLSHLQPYSLDASPTKTIVEVERETLRLLDSRCSCSSMDCCTCSSAMATASLCLSFDRQTIPNAIKARRAESQPDKAESLIPSPQVSAHRRAFCRRSTPLRPASKMQSPSPP